MKPSKSQDIGFDDYQDWAMDGVVYGPVGHEAVLPLMLCFSSMGMIAERVKKSFRDHGGEFTPQDMEFIREDFESIEVHGLRSRSELERGGIFPGHRAIYPVLGLVGEAGEVARKLLRLAKANRKEFTAEERVEVGKEIGDVLFYCAAVAREMGFSLSEIAQMNRDKLQSRRERGTVHGEGDNR